MKNPTLLTTPRVMMHYQHPFSVPPANLHTSQKQPILPIFRTPIKMLLTYLSINWTYLPAWYVVPTATRFAKVLEASTCIVVAVEVDHQQFRLHLLHR